MKYRIEQDQNAESPREWDNLGKMACWHRRYDLGDERPKCGPDEFIAGLPKGTVIVPIFAHEHGGITIRTGTFSDPWDSGQLGIIYATPKMMLAEYPGRKRVSAKMREQTDACLRQEVATYDQFLTGDVWGYVIEDDKGNHVDSCWGFFGHDYCEQEAKSALAYAFKRAEENANEQFAWECRR